MIRILRLVCPVFVLFVSCEPSNKKGLSFSDTVVYKAENGSSHLRIIDPEFRGIASAQKLVFSGSLENDSKQVIYPAITSWEINVAEGSRSLPVVVEMDAEQLAPGETTRFYLEFEPIGSRRLYQSTGLRGDIEHAYSATIYWKDESGSEFQHKISFETNEEDFRKTVQQYGLASNVTPLVLDKLIPVRTEVKLSNVVATDVSSIQLNGNEILEKGFWTRVTGKQMKDSISIELRMVNQSGEAVHVLLPQINLTDGQSSFSPARLKEDSIMILNGGRLAINLNYDVSIVRELQLLFDGIRTGKSERVYSADLQLKTVDLKAF